MSMRLRLASLPLCLCLAACEAAPPQDPQPAVGEPITLVDPAGAPEPTVEDLPPTPDPVVELEAPIQEEPAPPAASKQPWEGKDVRTAYSRAGSYLLKWRAIGGAVPKNKHFEIDLWLFKVGETHDALELFEGAVLATRGWMPDHGHGMVRQPRSTDLGDGHYRISGMLLHMGGFWQLFFDVVVDGQAESTQFDLTL